MIFFLIENSKYFSFFNHIFLEILIIIHKKLKKTNGLNTENYLVSNKKPKNKHHQTILAFKLFLNTFYNFFYILKNHILYFMIIKLKLSKFYS